MSSSYACIIQIRTGKNIERKRQISTASVSKRNCR
jgi:hypothetical protein